MKALYCGDIVGEAGRDVVVKHLPRIREELALDFVVVNGENAAGGFGITDRICSQLYEAGCDVITTGNHVWAQRDILNYIDDDPRLLRPHNFPKHAPGTGAGIYPVNGGRKALVVNVMGRVFMEPLDDPFAAVAAELDKVRLGETLDFVLVDIHAEATSEKMAMGHFCDGRASLVVGSHSHVPTADTQLLDGGTAYHTDAGMCGDYNSIIGMDPVEPMRRFIDKIPGGRFKPAKGDATLCAVYVETDDATGLAVHAAPLRVGGRLVRQWPL